MQCKAEILLKWKKLYYYSMKLMINIRIMIAAAHTFYCWKWNGSEEPLNKSLLSSAKPEP